MAVRRLVLLIAACLAAAGTAAATSTRVASMGGGGDYFEDADNVQRWYGSLPSYTGLMLLDLGRFRAAQGDSVAAGAVGQSLGLHLALGAGARWGVAGLYVYADDPAQDYRVLWGKAWKGLQLGVQYRFTNDSHYSQEDTREENDRTLGAGLRWELADRTWCDLSAEGTRTRDVAWRDGVLVLPRDLRTDTYALRWRLFHGLDDRTVLVPCVTWERALSPEWIANDWWGRELGETFLDDASRLTGGLGVNLLPDPDTMLQMSLSFERDEHTLSDPAVSGSFWLEREYVRTQSTVIRVGGETRLSGWLTVRGGAWKRMDVSRGEQRAGGETFGFAGDRNDAMHASLGCGLHLSRFDLDMLLTDEAPFNLGSWLTGAGRSADSTWAQMTLQYVF